MSDPTPLDSRIVKEEMFDVDAMQGLSLHEGVPETIKRTLKAYRKRAEDGNKVKVVYEYGKTMKSLQKGRVYAHKALGLQEFRSDIRAALGAKFYIDIDMVNSQPVLLVQLSKKHGWACGKLEEYVTGRSVKLAEIMEELGCDRDDAKRFCLTILFGAHPYRYVSDYYTELFEEVSMIARNCAEAYPDVFKACKGRPNPQASCLAHVIQDLEFNVLMMIDRFLAPIGGLRVLIHDGGFVLKERVGDIEQLLGNIEKHIGEMGYAISMAEKPLEHSFEFARKDVMRGLVKESEYQERKRMFEEKMFFCLETNTTCEDGDELRHVSKADGDAHFASYNFEKIIDGGLVVQSFFKDWIGDPTKATKNKLVFKPAGCGNDEYNLYRGMAGSVGSVVVPEVVERFKQLVNVNAGGDAAMNAYFTNWLALLVQKPHVIPGVALIVATKAQGSGKDTLFNFVGQKVVGDRYFKNIQNAKEEVFEKHSMAKEQCLFMKFEEANGYDNRQLSEVLKTLVTSKTATINCKGVKQYKIDTYPHLCMTTNNEVPVKVERKDRRFCISQPSDEFVGNIAFWKETYALFDKPEAGHSVWNYLMNVDLGGFEPVDFPKNEYHEGLAQAEVSPTDMFVEQLTELEECSASALYEKYVAFCGGEGRKYKAATLQWFGRQLASHKKIKRRLLDGVNLYSI